MKTWQFIKNCIESGRAVMLLYVLESKGSSPGRQGFHMAVDSAGKLCGSIGGGIMEHKMVEMSKARLAEGTTVETIHKQVHDKAAKKDQSGMICSGEQTIFLRELTPTELPVISALLTSMKACHNGTLTLSLKGLAFGDDIPVENFFYKHYPDGEFVLKEKTGFKNRLHIIGGGHCALALSKLMSGLDFHISVYEERSNLNTMEENIYAHYKKLLHSYAELTEHISGGDNVYVVIMTFGYRTDDVAVRAVLGKEYRYLGLLGSKSKIEKLFSAYEHSELDKVALAKIHSPIGLPIKSQTPNEIAISIAAEIIAEKNRFQ